MNPFIYTQENYWYFNNGKIDVVFNKPEWREGMRYVKSLIDEGLVSPLILTQDRAQLITTTSPNPTPVGAFSAISASFLGANDQKRLEYVILPPLRGPGGRQVPFMRRLTQVYMIITKNCKTPESLFALGDYMCSEEMSVTIRFGEKGVDRLDPLPGDVSVLHSMGAPPLFRSAILSGTIQNKLLGSIGPHLNPAKWGNGVVAEGMSELIALGRSIGPILEYTNKDPIIGLLYNEQEQMVMDEFHSTIISYVQESFSRFIMGDLSLDRDWDNYIAQFSRMGVADVIRATQSCWDRMSK